MSAAAAVLDDSGTAAERSIGDIGENMKTSQERGATAIEYALMLAAIASVIMAVAFAVGVKTQQGLQLALNLWP